MHDQSTEDLSCLDGPADCAGPVEWRTTPDREDFKSFPRCEFHFARRLDAASANLEQLSPCPPAWFDPSLVGERWDEDD